MLMRIGEAAKYTGLSGETLKQYVNDGLIPVVIIKRERRFRVEDLDRLMTPVNMADIRQQEVLLKRDRLIRTRRNKAARLAASQ